MIKVIPINDAMCINEFCSSRPEFNPYLKENALNDHKRGRCKVYCLVPDNDETQLLGFETLSPDLIQPLSVWPKRLNREYYNLRKIPMLLLGMLAVDKSSSGQGYIHDLLTGAYLELAHSRVGGMGLMVDAYDDKLAESYQRWGFTRLPENDLRLVKSLKQIKSELEKAQE